MKKSMFWTIMKILPFGIIGLFAIARIGQGTAQYNTLNDFMLQIYYIGNRFNFVPLRNTFSNLFQKSYFLVESTYLQGILCGILSYELLILILQLTYDIILFLPKMGIAMFEERKEKKK